MSTQTWSEPLITNQAAGTLFSTYTTAKSVTPAGCAYTFAPNFWVPGKAVRMTVLGAESHRITGPDTMTFQFQLGPTSNIAAFTSGAISCTTTAHTTIPFRAVCEVTCLTVGAGTSATLKGLWTIQAQGFAMTGVADTTTVTMNTLLMPNTAPAAGTGFDSTVANVCDFFVAQSFSGAGNGIQVHQYWLESLN